MTTPVILSAVQQREAQTYNHPCGDLLERGRRRDYIELCVPLHKASISGDWEAASAILKDHEYLIQYSITESKETPLHVATGAPSKTRSFMFVRKLVDMMEKDDLKLQNEDGNTAMCLAAIAGDVDMAMIIVRKNPELLSIHGSENMMPLYLAALHGRLSTVNYLYANSAQMTSDGWTDDDRDGVFLTCIETNLFDVAIKIVDDNKGVQFPQEKHLQDVLNILARKPRAFDGFLEQDYLRTIFNISSGMRYPIRECKAQVLLRKIWKKVVVKPKDEIDVILGGASCILFVAAERGNSKFLIELIREYPDLVLKRNDEGRSIFHIAILYRHQDIYNLLYEIGSVKDTITQLIDKEGNNMRHVVAMNPGRNLHEKLTGAAFQMRCELLWFKSLWCLLV